MHFCLNAIFGNGFEAVLAEDIVREEHNLGELAVIAHLHIMLALIDVMIFLLVVRKFDLKGWLHKIAMPLTILGTVVMSGGCWGVILWEEIAHTIIYAGSSLVLLGALLMTIAGIRNGRKITYPIINRHKFGYPCSICLRSKSYAATLFGNRRTINEVYFRTDLRKRSALVRRGGGSEVAARWATLHRPIAGLFAQDNSPRAARSECP